MYPAQPYLYYGLQRLNCKGSADLRRHDCIYYVAIGNGYAQSRAPTVLVAVIVHLIPEVILEHRAQMGTI